MLPCEFCEIFESSFLYETPLVAVFVTSTAFVHLSDFEHIQQNIQEIKGTLSGLRQYLQTNAL